MKAKYYPHVTVFGVAMMFIAPLCFVLSLPYLRTPEDSLDAEFADAIIDSAMASPESVASTTVPVESLGAGFADDATQSTRVAMLPPKPAAPAMEYAMPESATKVVDDTMAVIDMATIDEGKADLMVVGSDSDVPLPLITTVPEAAYTSPVVSPSSLTSDLVTALPQAAVPSQSGDEVFVEPKVAAGTHFDATAHLAMRNGSLGSSESQDSTASTDGLVADGRVSRKITKADERKMRSDMETLAGSGRNAVPKDGGFGISPEAVLEEVILQQPLESRMVARMENVVAVTKAQGWPIALVKSDLPDDYWWVQQMVGIRGNAFAARVNFGNEHSIRGSVYHLIFVFLDSPDEVRRFRIAKQFKDLPEGIRRSREYTFTRK